MLVFNLEISRDLIEVMIYRQPQQDVEFYEYL